MIAATKPELESIIRDAANGLIAAWQERTYADDATAEMELIAQEACITELRAVAEAKALRTELAASTATEWRLCWWSSLAGCGLTLAGLWLWGAL